MAADPGDDDSAAGFSPDELEVAGILLDLPDLIHPRRGLHWGATRRRSVPAPVARSPDTPLSLPASSPAKEPADESPVTSRSTCTDSQRRIDSQLKSMSPVTSRSTCADSQRIDSQLESMMLLLSQVGLQSTNADLPLDLNKPLPAETMLHTPEKSGDELESMVRLQSDDAAELLLDLNDLLPENNLGSSPGKSSDQLVPEGSRSIFLDLNFPPEESSAAEFSDEGRS